MITYRSVSGLRKLTKDEIGKVELNDEMREGIDLVFKKGLIYNGMPALFITLFMINIFSRISFSGIGDLVVCIPFLSVFIYSILDNVVPVFRLKFSEVQHSGFYKVSYSTHRDSDGHTHVKYYGVDESSMKRLPRVSVIGSTRRNITYGEEYLFVSFNGRRFFLIPVVKPVDYVCYSQEPNLKTEVPSNYVNHISWEDEDDCSDFVSLSNPSLLYSTNSSCLNDDEQFMFNKFKKSCFHNVNIGLFVALFNGTFFNVGLIYALVTSLHDFNTSIVLVLVLLFINFICGVFVLNGVKERKELKKIFSEMMEIELCEVSKVRGSVNGGYARVTYDLMRRDGFTEFGVEPRIIKLRHQVSVGDRMFLVKVADRYYCYPNKKTFEERCKR